LKRIQDIYANTISALVWLRPAENDSDQAIAEINKIGKHIVSHGALDLFLQLAKVSEADAEAYRAAKMPVYDLMLDYLQIALRVHFPVAACLHLLSWLYWERMWIVQEYVVSSKVHIYCSEALILFSHLQAVQIFLPFLKIYIVSTLSCRLQKSPAEEWDCSIFNYVIAMSEFMPTSSNRLSGKRRAFQADSGQGLYTLTQLLAKAYIGSITKASELKDRVFVLLGIASDAAVLGIVPDYCARNKGCTLYR
jgi:hypothetical protein